MLKLSTIISSSRKGPSFSWAYTNKFGYNFQKTSILNIFKKIFFSGLKVNIQFIYKKNVKENKNILFVIE